MAETKKLVPKRRFKEFQNAGEWEQRKLSNIGDTFTGLSGKTKEDFGHGDGKFITYMNVFSNAVADPSNIGAVEIDKRQNEVRFGDVLFTTSSETPEEVGMSSVWLENTENVYLNSFCFGYRPRVSIDKYYLAYMLRSPRVRSNIELLAQGISRYNISKTKVMEIEIPIPEKDEQFQIGTFFKNLDNLITLHQRKLDKIKSMKKAYLSEMFPAEGETKPKRRFKGFSGDWEQRILSDKMYIKARIGWQALSKSEYLKSGEYYLITGTDIDEESHTIDLNRSFYVTKDRYEMDSKIQVQEGDIIVTKDGTIGKVAIVTGLDKPATLNSHLFVLRDLSGKLNNYFLLTLLTSPIFDEFVEKTKTGSTLTGMPQKTFVNFSFLVPSIEEQGRIAEFFIGLNNLITLHQQKLDKLKNLKKAYLNEMFI